MDPLEVLQALTDAAERFVNKAPNQQRLETERKSLLDAIMQAQLLLSVRPRTKVDPVASPAPPMRPKRRRLRLAK
jgi:hypothetical protein